jgi:2-iminobutanoate/2-iminopropanoate deaminase
MSPKRAIGKDWPEYARLTYVPAVAARGEVLYTSGLNAMGPDGAVLAPGDVVGQARIIYERLAEILEAAGGSLADVVKTTDYIVSREGYSATAAVRREFLGPDFCAATGVVVRELLGRGVLIEIEAVVVLPADEH